MKHLEPLPAHAPKKQNKLDVSRRSSKLTLFVVGALLVAGLGFGMSALWGPPTSDQLSNTQKAELVAEFAKLKSVSVEQVAHQDLSKALETMRLAPDQRQKLEAELSAKDPSAPRSATAAPKDSPVLVWVTLWDFADPDGDIIHVSSAGYEIDIPLQKNQTRIAVPVDGSKAVKISGVRDGGGGITLGVQSGASPVALPVLTVGQSITLPVTY